MPAEVITDPGLSHTISYLAAHPAKESSSQTRPQGYLLVCGDTGEVPSLTAHYNQIVLFYRFFIDADVKLAGQAQCCGGSFLYGRIAKPFESCR